jgi:3-dehydroquinate synthase
MNPETNPMNSDAPLRVMLGERSYDIRFYHGNLAQLALDLRLFCPERALVVSNETIWAIHGCALSEALTLAEIDATVVHIGDGERHKTLQTASMVYDRLIEGRFSRRTCVIAFGGGVVGDLAGFVAATYMRGVDFVQIPTTVLAMVDSSVGGKTGVDHPLGKNMIGAFYQPRTVCIDFSLLRSLDEHNKRGGFAEIIKYGVIWDPKFFAWLEENIEDALGLEQGAVHHAVRVSCEAKARVVAQDEREGGLRAILNYGHTFAHAIESLGEYKERQYHGQAVSIGMVAAAEVAVRMDMAPSEDASRIRNLLARAGLPTSIPRDLEPAQIIDRMASDKKVVSGRLRFVLPSRIGKVEIRDDVPVDLLTAVIRDLRA